ncbi:MAG: phenylalanine 4-monooxygenase [Gammaproteobacteria bacterium]|nr:phenylalanine 4-monooxygenase [Gammaproteobacteria bacterium]
MEFVSRYVSHEPDEQGHIVYSSEEDQVWNTLFLRQEALLAGRASDAFIEGFNALELSADKIPQLPDISEKLRAATGWEVSPVAALISARAFFELLAAKKFPAATFIRDKKSLNYVKEPDIFHEIFGHCPMLTDKVYADFVHAYAKRVLTFDEADWPLLQRFFWFTVEFGLIQDKSGLRAYGGGILSSIGETPYSVESSDAMRVLFDPIAIFRMPYRIDALQPVYFVIDSYQMLYEFIEADWSALMARARKLGEYAPYFPVEVGNPSIHIQAC